jgi:hypothetical protein
MVQSNEVKDYEARKKLAVRAFEKGTLIYSTASRKFYTPREFLDSNEKVVITKNGLDELCNCKLHYPKNAIEKKLEDLRNAQLEFDMFMKKVMTAFELHPLRNPNVKNDSV